MAKTLRNATGAMIELNQLGIQIAAGVTYTVTLEEYLTLSKPSVISELSPLITNGSIIVGDGTLNITNVADAIRFLQYPDDARNIAFNNASNGFLAKTVQSAIEESKNTLSTFYAVNTTQQNTSSVTFTLLEGMSFLPPAGTYIAILEADCSGVGVNAIGEIALFRAGVQITESIRRLSNTITGLLSIGSNDVRSSLVSVAQITVNGSQLIQGGFRELDNDVFIVRNKSLTLIRVA